MTAAKAVDEINGIANKLNAEDENAKACSDEVVPEEEVMA